VSFLYPFVESQEIGCQVCQVVSGSLGLTAFGQLLVKKWISQNGLQSISQCLGVARVYHQAGRFSPKHFSPVPHIPSDYGYPSGQTLYNFEGPARAGQLIVIHRIYGDVGQAVQNGNLVPSDAPHKSAAARYAKLVSSAAQGAIVE